MPEPLPSKAGQAIFVKVEFTETELDDLDTWIGALPGPRPDREQAVRMVVSSRIKRLSPITGTADEWRQRKTRR